MTNRRQLDATDLNMAAAYEEHLASRNDYDEAYWKNQAEGNKRMRGEVDAMAFTQTVEQRIRIDLDEKKRQQEEINKRMKAAVDAMPLGGPLTSNALGKQVDGGHYKDLKIQPIEYIHANNIPFAEGCAIKYLTRWRAKGGIKDLEKAKHFIELLIELEARNDNV